MGYDYLILYGFVWKQGDKAYAVWQVDLSEEDASAIKKILEKYADEGSVVIFEE